MPNWTETSDRVHGGVVDPRVAEVGLLARKHVSVNLGINPQVNETILLTDREHHLSLNFGALCQ